MGHANTSCSSVCSVTQVSNFSRVDESKLLAKSGLCTAKIRKLNQKPSVFAKPKPKLKTAFFAKPNQRRNRNQNQIPQTAHP